MKILKNIFITLGVIFILVISFVAILAFKTSGFKEEYSPFVSKFMIEVSKEWKLNDLQHLVTNEFYDQINTPEGRQSVIFFKKLGKLKNIEDLELSQYRSFAGSNSYKLGIFTFKAEFENASTLVKMTVVVKDEKTQVHNLYINPTSEIKSSDRKIAI